MIEFIGKISKFDSRVALCFEGNTVTYSQFCERIVHFDNELINIETCSVVSIVSDYSFDSIALFFALAIKKCIVVPIVSLNSEEVKKRESVAQLDYSIKLLNGAVIIKKVTKEKEIARKHLLIQNIFSKKHSGLILFSSGSTGIPKAMIHDLDILIETYLNKKTKSLSVMVFLMFDHIGGLNTLLNSLSMGAKVVFPCRREAEHVAFLIESESVNLLPASPTFLNMMLIADVHNKYNLSSLRMITYGTESMPESLLIRIKEALPKVKLLQTFGTSETGIIQTSSRSSNSLDIRIDDPNQEYKIVNNELWLRSKTQVLGYLNHDMTNFSDDGWFKTGDLVEEFSDGFIKVVGRLKEVINVGGEKVLPSEIESVVLQLDEVMDCVAYSSPNAITGQTVSINIIVSKSVDEKEMKKKIRKHCIEKLDSFKVPTKIKFTADTGVSERFKKIRAHLND